MGLDFALDELMNTGWTALDTRECEYLDGRLYPTVRRVEEDFRREGFDFAVSHVQPFDCYRAQWSGVAGESGAVVGKTSEEAAVYALARFRRAMSGASAPVA
jgi:hypothetical protein